jgi:hypothetical protein
MLESDMDGFTGEPWPPLHKHMPQEKGRAVNSFELSTFVDMSSAVCKISAGIKFVVGFCNEFT